MGQILKGLNNKNQSVPLASTNKQWNKSSSIPARHMTGYKAYLADYQDINGGLLPFWMNKDEISCNPLSDLIKSNENQIESKWFTKLLDVDNGSEFQKQTSNHEKEVMRKLKLLRKNLDQETEILVTQEELLSQADKGEPNHKDAFHHCLFALFFLSQHDPKMISEALVDEAGLIAMQEELLQLRFKRRGTIDKTLFLKKNKNDIILVQVYVDDIIFGSTKKSWCDVFESNRKPNGIFHMPRISMYENNEEKFVFAKCFKAASTPIETQKPLVKDEEASYSDYAGANLDRKSTTGGCQFLGRRLITWQCKKQTIVATSTTEAEYVAAASCCGQVLWIQNQIPSKEYFSGHTMVSYSVDGDGEPLTRSLNSESWLDGSGEWYHSGENNLDLSTKSFTRPSQNFPSLLLFLIQFQKNIMVSDSTQAFKSLKSKITNAQKVSYSCHQKHFKAYQKENFKETKTTKEKSLKERRLQIESVSKQGRKECKRRCMMNNWKVMIDQVDASEGSLKINTHYKASSKIDTKVNGKKKIEGGARMKTCDSEDDDIPQSCDEIQALKRDEELARESARRMGVKRERNNDC
ncbi:hypothetical protein Tco_1003761 [Tanacetum coccineum]|uniref:Uncharacterized protein n=1 Tax=Tanacetum coccineum TaxID=301880 RepID=A0ABQ5FBG0_9ASTR